MRVYDDTKGAGRCRSCDAPITWFQLTSGKRHPFDGEPVYFKTEHEDATRRLIGLVDNETYKSHFATCPQAKDWKSKGQA